MSEVVVIAPDALRRLVESAVCAGVGEALARLHRKDTFTIQEAAEYLGVKPTALTKWRYEKRGPAYVKSGSRVVYLKADLDAWLAAGRIRTLDSLEPNYGKSC